MPPTDPPPNDGTPDDGTPSSDTPEDDPSSPDATDDGRSNDSRDAVNTSPSRHRLRRRLLRGAGLAGLVLALLGLAVALFLYAFLATPFGPRLVASHPERLQMEWNGARFVGLDRVAVDRYVIRGQSDTLRWMVEAEDATLTIDLPALARRHFSAHDIEVGRVRFLLAHHEPANQIFSPDGDPGAGHRPAISGFEGLAIPAPEPDPPAADGWRVELAGIAVDSLAEVWVDALRFEGDGRVEGTFSVVGDGGPVEVPEARLTEVTGDVTLGDDPLIQDLRLGVDASLDRFEPWKLEGVDALRVGAARVRLSGTVSSLAFAERWLGRIPTLDLEAHGTLSADLRIDDGVLRAPGRLDFEAGRLGGSFLDSRAEGPGRLRARIEARPATASGDDAEADPDSDGDDGDGGEGGEGGTDDAVVTAELSFPRFEARIDGRENPYVRGQDLTLRATSPDLDLTARPDTVDAVLDLPESELVDLTVYNRFLPADSGFEILGGRGTAGGRLEITTPANRASGRVRVEGDDVRLVFDAERFSTDFVFDGTIPSADLSVQRYDLSGTVLSLDDGRAAGTAPGNAWWARVSIVEGTARRGPSPGFEGQVAVAMKNLDPLIHLFERRERLVRWIHRVLEIEDLQARGRVRTDGDVLHLDRVTVTGSNLDAKARLTLARGRHEGVLWVRWRFLSAGLELAPGGDVDVHLRNSDEWFRRVAGF